MSSSFPRERVLEELHALREATQALHRRLESLIGEIDGDSPTDPRIVEIARRAIAELRAKQRARPSASTAARTAERLILQKSGTPPEPAAPSPDRNNERRPRSSRRQTT